MLGISLLEGGERLLLVADSQISPHEKRLVDLLFPRQPLHVPEGPAGFLEVTGTTLNVGEVSPVPRLA